MHVQDSAAGYDVNGIGRTVVLVLMAASALAASGAQSVSSLLRQRIAEPIDFDKHVLKQRI